MNPSFDRFSMAVMAVVMLVCAACTSTRVSLPSSDPVPHYDASRPRKISAEASGFQLLLFIPININDRHQKAWDALKAKAGADYIADVTIQDTWTYALVGTIYAVHLEANAYPITSP